MGSKVKKIITLLLAAVLLLPTFWLAPPVNAETVTKTSTVFHEVFSNAENAAKISGSASLTTVTDKMFDGNDDGTALYVSNRSKDYYGADFFYTDLGLKNGETYTVTLSVYVDAGVTVPSGSQFYLQNVGPSHWGFLTGRTMEAGKAVTLTKQFTVNTSVDHALRVQSNVAGSSVPFYIGDILVTQEHDEDVQPPLPQDPNSVLNVTFEDQTANGFGRRGSTETLTVSNEANHTASGAYALKVENRSANWHGPFVRIDNLVDVNTYYEISAWVKLISPASATLKLSTQIANDGTARYPDINSKTINANDGWVQLHGTYIYTDKGNDYVTLFIQTNDATSSFYIDDISIVNKGKLEIETDLIGIKDVYKDDFLIGTSVNPDILRGQNLQLLKQHYNTVTAGNYMKPDFLQKKKGTFTFENADELVAKAISEDMKVHGHVLVWHAQSPDWLTSQTDSQGNTITDEQGNKVPLSRGEALQNMWDYTKTVMEHFGDKVISWDVVNEAMTSSSDPTDWRSALRQSGWTRSVGDDFVEQAFLAARAVLDEHPEWNIKLYYNDYNLDDQSKATAVYSMVREINERYAQTHPGKLLIDGIGMQGHYNLKTSPQNVEMSLQKFISLGVTVSISELDINGGSNSKQTEAESIQQGYLYAKLFQLFKKYADHIERVTIWGLHDGVSWRKENSPLPFNTFMQAKPGYYGIVDPEAYIAAHPPIVKEPEQATAKYGAPNIDGTVDDVWSDAEELPVNKFQLAWQGATGIAKALWDDQYLYVLVQVIDTKLDQSSSRAHEQDSVEFFLDHNNGKTTYYEKDDGQYRVRYDNVTSFGSTTDKSGFVSATQVSGTNYTVEAKFPLKVTPSNGSKLGFDVQINDAKDGSRQSVAAWNDTSGVAYKDTSVYGELTLTGKASDNTPPVTEATYDPAAPNGQNGWYVSPVTVNLTVADAGSGAANSVYSLDGGATWQTYSAPIVISQDGRYDLRFYSVDQAGNEEPVKSLGSINIDQTAPSITIDSLQEVYPNEQIAVATYAVYDGLSNVNEAATAATLDGQPVVNGASLELYKLPLGTHTLTVTAADNAGNTASSSVTFTTATSLESLQALVGIFQANGSIDNHGIANSLQSMVSKNNLKPFINLVNAQKGKYISTEAATILLRDAQSLLK
ncbi:endo-1,4-beta-xylanase [Paenibacillus sp. N4]|uniref:endo-1,4-beta-xylanase n=1 Tax=Paenibacillus vietnamensis TaxID=2590547 RepID=UPI001CD04D4F|nr:endo-1,4-beta-xylanase [Paenibacillus vietnamensis]MCA0757290.1 endo-1,4-beta-xylanase [Paenibacillus vietnamensis]